MERTTKNILIGVLTSVFLSPLVGGGVAGYLKGPDIREGVKIGGIVGSIVAVVSSGIVLLITYYSIYQPIMAVQRAPVMSGEFGYSQILLPYLVVAVFLFVSSTVTALIGGGIGSYIAGYEREDAESRKSAS